MAVKKICPLLMFMNLQNSEKFDSVFEIFKNNGMYRPGSIMHILDTIFLSCHSLKYFLMNNLCQEKLCSLMCMIRPSLHMQLYVNNVLQ